MPDYLCWHADDWKSLADALANPAKAAMRYGFTGARGAAENLRYWDDGDPERGDEITVYVQRVDWFTAQVSRRHSYIGDPVVVDVVRRMEPRYSGTVRKEVDDA